MNGCVGKWVYGLMGVWMCVSMCVCVGMFVCVLCARVRTCICVYMDGWWMDRMTEQNREGLTHQLFASLHPGNVGCRE